MYATLHFVEVLLLLCSILYKELPGISLLANVSSVISTDDWWMRMKV